MVLACRLGVKYYVRGGKEKAAAAEQLLCYLRVRALAPSLMPMLGDACSAHLDACSAHLPSDWRL